MIKWVSLASHVSWWKRLGFSAVLIVLHMYVCTLMHPTSSTLDSMVVTENKIGLPNLGTW
jgi:hypothetical protein